MGVWRYPLPFLKFKFMKHIFLLTLLLFTLSVIVNILLIDSINVYKHQNKELNIYKHRFLKEAELRKCKVNKKTVELSFGKLAYVIVGKDTLYRKATSVVRWPFFLKNEIIVDIDWYRKSTEFEREQTLFHELGHIYLNRKHYNAHLYKDRVFIPISIMNRINTQHYEQNKEYYLNELFRKTKD